MIAWEPVPTFRAFLEYGVELNRLGALVEVRAAAVGDKEGAEYELVVPQRGIWGTASIDGRNIDKCAALMISVLQLSWWPCFIFSSREIYPLSTVERLLVQAAVLCSEKCKCHTVHAYLRSTCVTS